MEELKLKSKGNFYEVVLLIPSSLSTIPCARREPPTLIVLPRDREISRSQTCPRRI